MLGQDTRQAVYKKRPLVFTEMTAAFAQNDRSFLVKGAVVLGKSCGRFFYFENLYFSQTIKKYIIKLKNSSKKSLNLQVNQTGKQSMEEKYCQSCGMPLVGDSDRGVNRDQTLSDDYCCYCYEKGQFTRDCTMEQMIETCAQFVDEFNKDSDVKLTKEEAISRMRIFFPQLKRWKTN